MIKSIKGWLRRNVSARPQSQSPTVSLSAAPKEDKPRPQHDNEEFWRQLLSLARGKLKKNTALAPQVRSLRLPDAAPGVLPKGVDKPPMALDSQIADTYKFGVSGAWDGSGFMGYAYLAELTQIPEFRNPCEKLANDATRKWGSVRSASKSGDKDAVTQKIDAINAEFKRLGVQEAFRWGFEKDGEFGRAQIFLDLGEEEGDELKTPLDMSIKIKKGGLKGLRLVEPLWTYPNAYNSDNPLRPDFYRPQTWYVLGQEVHSSRLLNFNSRPVPDILKPAYMFGGIALIQLMWVCVENWMRTRQSVSDLIHAFSTFVLSTDMAQDMTPEGARNLAFRAAAFTELRDNLGLMVVQQGSEGLTNVSAPLGSLDRLQAQSQEHMAAICGIPLVVLFGLDPAGLNATGDSQVRVYYQNVESLQQRIGTPNMRIILEAVQMSLFEEIDPSIEWAWEPLWTMTAKELAEIRKIEAETGDVLINNGSIAPQEERQRVAADLDSDYVSINVDDEPDLLDEEAEGLEPHASAEKLADGAETGDDALDRLFDASRSAA